MIRLVCNFILNNKNINGKKINNLINIFNFTLQCSFYPNFLLSLDCPLALSLFFNFLHEILQYGWASSILVYPIVAMTLKRFHFIYLS